MKPRSPGPALHYRVEAADPHAHLFHIRLTLARPLAHQRVSLPVWIPGSYLVREFSKSLQQLTAQQGGKPLALRQADKCTWDIDCQPDQPLVLQYQVHAFDTSVRAAWLDSHRGFFNGTSLCLRVHGQEDSAHQLELVAPTHAPRWSAACGLKPVKVGRRGFGTYQAADYDELVDSPVELGEFVSASFEACGVPHRLVVAGATEAFDAARLVADTKKICETQIRFWHGHGRPPHKDYLFLLNVVDDGYGGLEHRNSTALIAARRDLPRLGEERPPEGYTTLLGLISHEYFHTWNVKRLRPAEFARYDYARENYSELLWFFEGFTSYYDDLLLRRAGLIDDATYLKLLTKTLNQVLQTPGRAVQSVAQASFDAWVKYYRQDENTPNATVSYYTKGALVALCFDLTLRRESRTHLDEVMRALWRNCKAGPMSEATFAETLQTLGGRSFARELAAWVHGTRELPVAALLASHGIDLRDEPAQLQQRLGLRVSESGPTVIIKTVLRGGAAEQAGMAAHDEWLAVEVAGQAWRLAKLDDLKLYAGRHRKLTALVARDRRLLRLPLQLPTAATTCRLVLREPQQAQAWLASNA